MDDVIFARPAGCTCRYEEASDENQNYVIRRIEDEACPRHGVRQKRKDRAVQAGYKEIRRIPGAERTSMAAVKRLIDAVTPIILGEDEV